MFEMFTLSFMLNAFLACLLFSVLLSYLGIHVVGRGIVFVDLALGQISSFGVAISQFFHFGEAWFPIVFTLLGSVLLSFIRIRDPRLKLEAVIGIIYVVTAAITVLVISKTPHGEADIQEVLFGALLAVTGQELLILALVFAALVILHILFGKQMFNLTERMEAGEVAGFTLREQSLNFFFYLSIGLAIVYAVRIGGVLPVFSFLVVPAVAAVMVARRNSLLIIIAFLTSALASFLGLWFSFTFDFPAGPSIVTLFGALFILAVIFRLFRQKVFRSVGEETE